MVLSKFLVFNPRKIVSLGLGSCCHEAQVTELRRRRLPRAHGVPNSLAVTCAGGLSEVGPSEGQRATLILMG